MKRKQNNWKENLAEWVLVILAVGVVGYVLGFGFALGAYTSI